MLDFKVKGKKNILARDCQLEVLRIEDLLSQKTATVYMLKRLLVMLQQVK